MLSDSKVCLLLQGFLPWQKNLREEQGRGRDFLTPSPLSQVVSGEAWPFLPSSPWGGTTPALPILGDGPGGVAGPRPNGQLPA